MDFAAQPARPTAGSKLTAAALAALTALCALTLTLGFLNKDRCTGPSFDSQGRTQTDSQRPFRDWCYSDIQSLWVARDIDKHTFPYISGSLDESGNLTGGAIEYPVLTGVLVWLGATFASNDAQYLMYSAILLAPFGLLTGWLLGRLTGWRALLWAFGPPLILYAFHNWDLPAAAAAVAAVYVLHRGWGKDEASRPFRQRAVASSVLLGLGCALKLYPGIFVLPLMFYVFTGGQERRGLAPGRRYDARGAAQVALAALGTVALVNLPFAILGFDGWRASFIFQGQRNADISTNSIWYWAFRPDTDRPEVQHLIGTLSPIAVLLSFVLACAIGWRRYRHEGTYPWIGVSASMLCGFLLLHKVHSPQYTIWLVPMFVLMRIRLGWVVAYYVADAAIGIGIFRWFNSQVDGRYSGIYEGFAAQAVMIGVWGRAALLVGLFVAFLSSKPAFEEIPAAPPALHSV
ncbi:DUF2029 domain-containing protein [Amycolatopsis sp. SID8362]|nr:glycosyltransferase 87 family protein [Amycolatopsis sp. SID8362]NBH11803.1 DUF2029 domain-containing protein [Amycolatopsis sp. SID8362]NED48495.1 DUF2029 domain-containing protein [Amycolatopsis sp. SID8362]